MIPLAEAQSRIAKQIKQGPVVRLAVADADGHVLAGDVISEISIPPFTSVAMDGFAVRAADTAGATFDKPVELPVVGTIAAGQTAEASLMPGQAMKIMTGAPLPEGADAVIMVELTDALQATDDRPTEAASVKLLDQVSIGNHLRAAGSDVEAGDVVASAGTRLGAATIGLLCSVGVSEVDVFARPVVGVISTGDELVSPPRSLAPGQIYDSNRPMLLSLVARSGCTAIDLGHVSDDEDAVSAAFTDGAKQCDAIISTGGVSMGDYDPVRAVLSRIAEVSWMQVAIKPAKPLSFATLEETPIFGLPGNPVSAAVSFELFARPSLRSMMGDDKPHRRVVAAIADSPLRRRFDGKTHFVRVVASLQADGALHVRSAGEQGSHQLSALAAANALAILPDGAGYAPGDRVNIVLVDDTAFASATLNLAALVGIC